MVTKLRQWDHPSQRSAVLLFTLCALRSNNGSKFLCFPQVLPPVPGRFSYLETCNWASLTAYLSTSDCSLYLYFCWWKGNAAIYYPGLSFLLWPNNPITLFLTFTLFRFPSPSTFSLGISTNFNLNHTKNKNKKKLKPCYSFKLSNQFTFLSLSKAPNEFLYFYWLFYYVHSISASLIRIYSPKINKTWKH